MKYILMKLVTTILSTKEMMMELQKQNIEVLNYFNEIKKEDTQLDIESFFERVVNSLKKNGIEMTSKCYDLDIAILKQIKY